MNGDARTKSVLKRAAAQAFEGLCFLDVVHEGMERPERWDTTSEVRFRDARGDRHGAVVLRLSGIAPSELATAMLGDGVDTEALAHDALGEITNVMCGTVLSDLLGPEAVFDLQHPTVRVAPAGSGGSETSVLLGVEEGVAELAVALDGTDP